MSAVIVSLLIQLFNPNPPAYTCHRFLIHPDQSLTCETGDRFEHGRYRFERGSNGLVAIVEP
jgi:hypothetical protein